jgi:hypothetical protein
VHDVVVEVAQAYNLHEYIDIHIYYVGQAKLHHNNKEHVYNVNMGQVDVAHNEQAVQTRLPES